MMGLGWQELLIVLVMIKINFGAGKTFKVGSAVDRGPKELRAGDDQSAKAVGPGASLENEGMVFRDRARLVDHIEQV